MATIDKKAAKAVSSLYLQDKYSVAMIAEKLGFSVHQVRHCLEKNNVPRRSRSEATFLAHFHRFNRLPCNIKRELTPKERDLFVAGIMLYWAEGWKKNSQYASFSNSDPKMIRLFLMFLRKLCGIQEGRVRLLLHLYEDQNEKELRNFWSEVTNVPLSQFNSSYLHKAKPGNYKRKSEHGTISLRYGDKKLLEQILEWIDDCLVEFNIFLPR